MDSDARKHHAAALRSSAAQLVGTAVKIYAAADAIDPPAPSPDHSVRSICGACGTEYRGREYATGQRCESCDERGETGYLRRATTCRLHEEAYHESEPCTCTESDEPLTTKDGQLLGVTMDELAMSQAALDASAELMMGDDNDLMGMSFHEFPSVDIATTFSGRGRCGS